MTPTRVRSRRRAIKPSVRRAVIARDGMRCRYCGGAVQSAVAGDAYSNTLLHLDHVIPWAMGGLDTADNLVVSCARCNLRRLRPAPGASRDQLIWSYEDGEYYWDLPRYRPPNWVEYRHPDKLFTLGEVAQILDRTIEDVLVLITTGAIRGTTGTSRPIRAQFAPDLTRYVERRMDELGWEE